MHLHGKGAAMKIVIYFFFSIFLLGLSGAVGAGPDGPPGAGKQWLSDLDCTTDQIAQFDGENWVCAYAPGEKQYQVVDGDGEVVGDVLPGGDISQHVWTKITFLGQTRLMFVTSGTIYPIDTIRIAPIKFTEPDCAGGGHVPFPLDELPRTEFLLDELNLENDIVYAMADDQLNSQPHEWTIVLFDRDTLIPDDEIFWTEPNDTTTCENYDTVDWGGSEFFMPFLGFGQSETLPPPPFGVVEKP